jgi:hypothetical protein
MRIFIPLFIMYGSSFCLLSLMVKQFSTKLAVYAAIFTSILMAVLGLTSLLLDQGYVWTQFALPILAVFVLLGLYKIASMMAANLNKGK